MSGLIAVNTSLLPIFSSKTHSSKGYVRVKLQSNSDNGHTNTPPSEWPEHLLEIPLDIDDFTNYSIFGYEVVDGEKLAFRYELANSSTECVSHLVFNFKPENENCLSIYCPTVTNTTDWMKTIDRVITVANKRAALISTTISSNHVSASHETKQTAFMLLTDGQRQPSESARLIDCIKSNSLSTTSGSPINNDDIPAVNTNVSKDSSDEITATDESEPESIVCGCSSQQGDGRPKTTEYGSYFQSAVDTPTLSNAECTVKAVDNNKTDEEVDMILAELGRSVEEQKQSLKTDEWEIVDGDGREVKRQKTDEL